MRRRLQIGVLAVVAASLLVAAAPATAATLTLAAVADATIHEDDPAGSTANGGGINLFVGRVGESAGSKLRRGLVRFDLTAIPPGSTITSVSVRLSLTRSRFAGDLPVSLHRAVASWTEGPSSSSQGNGDASQPNDVTWIHRSKPGQLWATPGGDFAPVASATRIVASTGGPYVWASTPALVADVQAWVNAPGTNQGWMILGSETGGTSAKGFATREASEPTTRPTLVVEYTPAGSADVPLPLWALVLLGGLLAAPRLRARLTRGAAPLALTLTALLGLLLSASAMAASYDEAIDGDLSNDRLAPTPFVLTFEPGGMNGMDGNNILAGTVGRGANGSVDRDYVFFAVPEGYFLSALRVGNQTTVGGGGSFIGLASGATMPLDPGASSAQGLLGWKLYTAADRGTDILDDMAVSGDGASGFARPLAPGGYTLWIQELATGAFTYRFNLTLSPVPEPTSLALLAAGLGFAAWRARALGNARAQR